jgi:hypothetical protein
MIPLLGNPISEKEIEKTRDRGQIGESMKRVAMLLACFSFLGVSCERHSWEDTKGLHKHGGGGSEDHGSNGHAEGEKKDEAPH